MKEMIGFWIICLAVDLVIVFLFGWELDTKTKLFLVGGLQIFIGLLEIGLYLMGVK